jgi:hypothetical protein
MSYRPQEQSIEDPLRKIMEGIDEFSKAVRERINDRGEWDRDHIKEINDVRVKLYQIYPELSDLADNNW